MSITDHEIQAYVDGELAPEDAARVEAAVAGDVMVAARVEREKRLRAKLRGAFDPVLDEPVPDRLHALLEAPAPASAAASQRHATGRRRPWRTALLAAAASVAALAVSGYLRPGAEIRMEDGRMLARGALARDLDQALAGAPRADDATAMGLSFRDGEGRVCRSFVAARLGTAGLACRDGAGWALEVLGRVPRDEAGEVRQAASAMPPEVEAAVDARLQGEVFDAQQERAARDAGWR